MAEAKCWRGLVLHAEPCAAWVLCLRALGGPKGGVSLHM